MFLLQRKLWRNTVCFSFCLVSRCWCIDENLSSCLRSVLVTRKKRSASFPLTVTHSRKCYWYARTTVGWKIQQQIQEKRRRCRTANFEFFDRQIYFIAFSATINQFGLASLCFKLCDVWWVSCTFCLSSRQPLSPSSAPRHKNFHREMIFLRKRFCASYYN